MEYTIHLGEDTLKQLDEIVNGGESGGGGDSDFSIAEMLVHVTITGTVPPFGVGGLGGFFVNDDGWINSIPITESGNLTIKVPLYHHKNDTIFTSASGSVVNTFTAEKVSGDVTITQDEDGYAITVEGDCEININAVIASV